jgi:hypothetical protein
MIMSRPISLRAHIEDTLELIADRDAQLRYQAEVPCVDVSTELFLQWEDWYRPESEAFADAFDHEQAQTLRVFNDVFAAVRTNYLHALPPIGQFVQTTAWKRYSGAARAALGMLRSALKAA